MHAWAPRSFRGEGVVAAFVAGVAAGVPIRAMAATLAPDPCAPPRPLNPQRERRPAAIDRSLRDFIAATTAEDEARSGSPGQCASKSVRPGCGRQARICGEEQEMARFEGAVQEFADVSAQAASPDALYELGMMYCVGRDVEADLVAAHKWFNLAAVRGNTDAKRMRTEISREMSRDEIAAAQRQAREWLTRH
jgi:hypothetical protein